MDNTDFDHQDAPELRQQLQDRYDKLWHESVGCIEAGRVEIDPVLAAGLPDSRRGLTVIARPSAAIARAVAHLLSRFRHIEPGQYYYEAGQIHLTVLSLFTATANPEPFMVRRHAYIAAADEALREAGALRVSFHGVTTSPGTVMVQGFVDHPELHRLRDRLRGELQERGLGGGIDGRYRLETAHMTVMRFRAPLRHSKELARVLLEARDSQFGESTIEQLLLVENDWYMSPSVTRIVKQYPQLEAW